MLPDAAPYTSMCPNYGSSMKKEERPRSSRGPFPSPSSPCQGVLLSQLQENCFPVTKKVSNSSHNPTTIVKSSSPLPSIGIRKWIFRLMLIHPQEFLHPQVVPQMRNEGILFP